jgi:hypothetical protein
MASFTFNNAPLNYLNSGTYYAIQVSAQPSETYTSVSQLARIPGINPVTLTGRIVTATGLIFDNFLFPFANYVDQVLGFVIAKQLGSQPQDGDELLLYSGYINILLDSIVIPPGSYASQILVDTVNGVLKRIPAYRYFSGSAPVLANGVVAPKGIMYLAGIRNNLANTYANPADSVRVGAWRSSDGASLNGLYDRTASNDGSPNNHILDMKANKIRVGQMLLMTNGLAVPGVQIFGSNAIEPLSLVTGTVATTFNNDALWTQISAATNAPGSNAWTSVQSTDTATYWSYLKITYSGTVNNALSIIEFMNSTFQSKTLNMVP